MKYLKFIRDTRNPSVARQEFLMREYDAWARVVDDIDDAIKMMRKDRAIVVGQVGLLAPVGPQLKDVARRIHERKAIIVEAATGRRSDNIADAFEIGIDAMKRKTITSEQAKEIARQYSDEVFFSYLDRWNAGERRLDMANEIGCSLATFQRRMHEIGAKPRKAGRRAK